MHTQASLVAQKVKNISLNVGDPGSIPVSGRPPGEGNGKILPREFQGPRSLAGCSPWGFKESDMIEWLTLSLSPSYITQI